MSQQMLVKNPYDTYKEQGVLMASPVELIIMLYDGCKKNLSLAKRDIDKKQDPASAHNHLIKAQNIVEALIDYLDMSFSISKELLRIYEFMLHEMTEINAAKDSSRIDPLIDILMDLRSAWQEVDEAQKGNKLIAEGQE